MNEEIEDIKRQLETVQKDLDVVKQRNMRVEADKAWETSFARVLLIAVLTYLGSVLVFTAIGVKNSLSNACIPSLAFVISTLSLPPLKGFWIKRNR